MVYYQNQNPPVRLSKFYLLPEKERGQVLKHLEDKKEWWVEIVAYCLMPNHFHFMLEQVKNEGITNFIRRLNNSYSHFFNVKYKRSGPLLEGRFKAVHIESDEQLLHLNRYIHLNPYSSFIVKDLKSILGYKFSSLPEYLGKTKDEICQKKIVLDQFSSVGQYKKSVFDQADYQRSLEIIKHQTID